MPLLVTLVSAVADVLVGSLATGCAACRGCCSSLGAPLSGAAWSALEAGAGAACVTSDGPGLSRTGAGIACVIRSPSGFSKAGAEALLPVSPEGGLTLRCFGPVSTTAVSDDSTGSAERCIALSRSGPNRIEKVDCKSMDSRGELCTICKRAIDTSAWMRLAASEAECQRLCTALLTPAGQQPCIWKLKKRLQHANHTRTC